MAKNLIGPGDLEPPAYDHSQAFYCSSAISAKRQADALTEIAEHLRQIAEALNR